MKKIIASIILVSATLFANGQCSSMGLSVSASDTAYVQLYHPGFFLIPSGFANTCEWEVTTFSGEVVFQDATSGDAFEQGQVLFDHMVPITDSMEVTVAITNTIEGIICTVTDTLFWKETEVLPGIFIGNWDVLNIVGGVEEVLTSTAHYGGEDNDFKVFPSPFDTYFQIEGSQDLYSLSLLNLSGQVIESYASVSLLEKVDVSHLPAGMYFVQFLSADRSSYGVKRMVKAK
ncbi:T9SS type A sorting domain-containing protein [Cryomorphaceae bacterium 1068]|nr:T9SS type A sorting domain-containing protein [Cryomorphaceae bacterium 1068]